MRKRRKTKPPVSSLEKRFLEYYKQTFPGAILPKREYYFSKYPWRFDYAWPKHKIAVELEGGIFKRRISKSNHIHPIRYHSDCTKYNYAQSIGWIVLRFTVSHFDDDQHIYLSLRNAFKLRSE